MDYLLLEILKPMYKEDFDHFLKDRLKLAKNLKQLLKGIARKKLVLDGITGLHLFGMHVYRNKIHLHRMPMPLLDVYCFSEIMSFHILIRSSLFPKNLPQHMKNLFKMLDIVHSGYLAFPTYLMDYEDCVSEDNNSDGDGHLFPPYVSPQKTGTKRKAKKASGSKLLRPNSCCVIVVG